MIAFISWYILVTILGWLTFPLVYYLFPALADRGYTLARAFGLLIWGYIFWLFASFHIAQNDIGGLLLGLVILGGSSVWVFINLKSEIVTWLRENLRLIMTTEILFLLAFGLMAFVRSTNPETATAGGEKWMEVAFINAILHSPTFPPHDPWLSGYAISYYYFGYVMAAMLAKFTSVPASVAHNLMLSLIFGLSAIGAYGLLYNLLVNHHRSRGTDHETGKMPSFGALFAPLFLLIVSNLDGLFNVLHRRGIGWILNPDGTGTSSFWKWLDLRELTGPPAQPLQWTPDHYIWWWRASRVIQDYDLNGTWHEVIDEFPFFSYLLGDLHPHVLAMPFDLLAIVIALNIFLGGWCGRINLFFGELRISKAGFFIVALVLGGLAFLNTWDIVFAGVLIVFSYALVQVRATGWGWERIEDILLLGIPLAVTAFVLYLPFFVGFDSQAGGILPNFMYPTRGTYLWIMWGTLFIPLFGFLIYLLRNYTSIEWRARLATPLGILIVLLAAMFSIGFLALKIKPEMIDAILQVHQRMASLIADSLLLWLKHIGSLLTLLALLILTLALLFRLGRASTEWRARLATPLGILIVLLAATFSIGLALKIKPELVNVILQAQQRMASLIADSLLLWLKHIGSLLMLLALILTLAFLFQLGRASAEWRASLMTTFGILVVLLAAMFALGFLALKVKPDLVKGVLDAQQRTVSAFVADSMLLRLKYIGGLLTLLALLIPSLAFLFGYGRFPKEHINESRPSTHPQPFVFVLLLVFIGILAILGPEFVYLRDNFGYRMNTVFKFYFQAWILLSLAAAFGIAVMLSELRGVASAFYTSVVVIVIGLGLIYPAFSLPKKTNNFKVENPGQRTLDGAAYLANMMPDDYQAIQFMQQLEPGVVAEAVGGSYTEHARVATFTGMPAVLNWPGHEGQWRDYALQGSRQANIETLYMTNDWATTQEIINRYHIRYIYVGNLERTTYRVNEEKFNRFLKPVFQQGSVTVYEVP